MADAQYVEEWRPVYGWEGLYEVSSLGRLKRIAPGQGAKVGRIHKIGLSSVGYPQCSLKHEGRMWKGHVHTLVCEAFHGPRPANADVAHADGTRTNNRSENLRWATRSENIADAMKHGTLRTGESRPDAKLTEDRVRLIRTGSRSDCDFGRMFGVSPATVRLARLGINWRHVLG